MMLSAVDLFVCFLLAIVFLYYIHQRSGGPPLPPGPKGLPVIGNLLDMPTSKEWTTYSRWATEFHSDVIYLKILGTNLIVLNSVKAVKDLFEKRSAIYSDRPRMVMVCELMGWDWFMAPLPYGEKWRERRRLFQHHFHNSNMKFYHSKEAEYVPRLLSQLLDTPGDFMAHVHHLLGGITISLAYGVETLPVNDPYVKLADEAMITISQAGVPGAFLVDSIPILKYIPEWFPGASFKRKAREWRVLCERFRDTPFNDALLALQAGNAQPSFTSLCLDELDETKDIEHQMAIIRDTAGMFFGAGSETTASSLNTFFLAMTCYPEVQKKAQDEIDRVIGFERLPLRAEDVSLLPYVSALVKEVIRWQSITPLAIPHRLTQDDIYKGYFLPRGSVVLPNLWAMLHNEDDYPDPFIFNPERYLMNGVMNPEVIDPESVVFGFGRRSCAGTHIAMSILFTAAASILATFTVSKAVGDSGQVIEPSLEYTSSIIVSHPKPFKCSILPRSEKAEDLIRASHSDM